MPAYSRNPARAAALAAPAPYPAAKAAVERALGWMAASRPIKAVAAFAAAWAVERRARKAVLELRTWPDHMLRDIGLERMAVEAAVRGLRRPFQRTPFHWQPDCDAAAPRWLDTCR